MELMLSLIGAIAGLISIIDFFLRRPNVFFLFLTWALAVALGYQLLLWVGPALIGQQSWLTDNVTGENSPVGSVLPSFLRVLVGSFLHSLVIAELVLPAYLIAMFELGEHGVEWSCDLSSAARRSSLAAATCWRRPDHRTATRPTVVERALAAR